MFRPNRSAKRHFGIETLEPRRVFAADFAGAALLAAGGDPDALSAAVVSGETSTPSIEKASSAISDSFSKNGFISLQDGVVTICGTDYSDTAEVR